MAHPRHEFERRIRLAETDKTGFAHFATYVRLMEETEYSFLRSRGMCVVLHDSKGTIGFPRISVDIQIHEPVSFDEQVLVTLELLVCDGKQLAYHFEIINAHSEPVATGQFNVASCRFPVDADPFAILTPQFVIDALTGDTINNN